MKNGLKVSGVIAAVLLLIFGITKLFDCLNQPDNAMVVIGISGFLFLIVFIFFVGGAIATKIKKATSKEPTNHN